MSDYARVWVGHRRIGSAVHRVQYLTRATAGHREDSPETSDPRVLSVESFGFDLPYAGGCIDARECARRLLALAGVGGRRSQIVELLIAFEPSCDRSMAVKQVPVLAADALALLGAERALLVIHADRSHIHGHVAMANDRGDGRCLEIRPEVFLRLRRHIASWTDAPVRSAWGTGREMEHSLVRLRPTELREEIRQRRLGIVWDQHGHATAIRDLRDRRRRKARIAAIERLWPGWTEGVLGPALQPQQTTQPLAAPPTSTRYPAELVADLRARLAALPSHRRDATVR